MNVWRGNELEGKQGECVEGQLARLKGQNLEGAAESIFKVTSSSSKFVLNYLIYKDLDSRMLLLFKSLINFNFKYDNIVNFKNLINIVLQATNWHHRLGLYY